MANKNLKKDDLVCLIGDSNKQEYYVLGYVKEAIDRYYGVLKFDQLRFEQTTEFTREQ